MNKRYIVTLTPEERRELEQMVTTGKAAARTLLRAWTLLKADASPQGCAWTDEQIRQTFGIGLVTIYRVRQSFVEDGLKAALARKPLSRHRPRKLDGDQEAHLIALACSPPPSGWRRWTLRLLTDKMVEFGHCGAVSPETVRQTLKKTRLANSTGKARNAPGYWYSFPWEFRGNRPKVAAIQLSLPT
jgi:transposase